MKKILTYVLLILFSFTFLIFNTYAALNTKKVNYKQPLTFDNTIDLRNFIEMHYNLIDNVKEKKVYLLFCKYLDNKGLRLEDIFLNGRLLYTKEDTLSNEMDTEIILGFTNNEEFVCGDVGKKISGVKLFSTYAYQLKNGTKNFSFSNMKSILDVYVDIGDMLLETLLKVTVYNLVQQDISLKNPIYASYFNQIKDITGDNTTKIFSDTNNTKFDPFTAPLYICYLDSKTKKEMKNCLKTFYNTIKDNTTINKNSKNTLKEIDNIFTGKKKDDK